MMLRILLCITCCGAPPTNRRPRPQRKVSGELSGEKAGVSQSLGDQKNNQLQTQDEVSNFKNLITLGKTDKELMGKSEVNSVLASDSEQKGKSDSESRPDSRAELAAGAIERDLDKVLPLDQTPPSSIDMDAFREGPIQTSSYASDQSTTAHVSGSTYISPVTTTTRLADDEDYLEPGDAASTGGLSGVPDVRRGPDAPSTSKIGDYARIEYSPLEDLESVTTISASRYGADQSMSGGEGNLSQATSRPVSEAAISRRSSRAGFESSISIASQLSNEQLQQNLTNALETGNSPVPIYGTIGLPLGPPLDLVGDRPPITRLTSEPETARTSPETIGAALTSASQDSLSDSSLNKQQTRAVRPRQPRPLSGAALVADESVSGMEDSVDLGRLTQSAGDPNQRVGSPNSIATTNSLQAGSSLVNPTPTPSELSVTSSQKKKRKLKAKSLLKRLRMGGSKKKSDKEDQDILMDQNNVQVAKL